jgi:hypothetical protein
VLEGDEDFVPDVRQEVVSVKESRHRQRHAGPWLEIQRVDRRELDARATEHERIREIDHPRGEHAVHLFLRLLERRLEEVERLFDHGRISLRTWKLVR